MKCVKCGINLGENDVFCSNCGAPVEKAENNNNQNMYTYENNVNQQQPYQQNYEQPQQNYGQYQQNYEEAKGKNAGDIIRIVIAVIIAVVILIAIGYVGYKISSKKPNDEPETTNELTAGEDNQEITGTLTGNSGTGNTTSVSKSSYKVSYAGFKFSIPDNLIYETDYTQDCLIIYDEGQTWVAMMTPVEVNFQQMKKNKSYLSSALTQQGYDTASIANIETINGLEYITSELSKTGENALVAYAQLNSMYSMTIVLANEDNDFNKEPLKVISTIISTAEYEGDSSYIKANEGIKITDIKEATQKLSETKDGE